MRSSAPAIRSHPPHGEFPSDSRRQTPAAKSPKSAISTTASGRALPSAVFGAGTFSRSYRGNFERWHVKAGVHKYQNVPANQFAVFVQPQGEPPRAAASLHRQAGRRIAFRLELVLPGRRRRLCRALSQVLVRLSLSSTSHQLDGRAVFSDPPQQLQGNQLSGRALQLVCGESFQQAGDGFASIFLDQHGGLVSRYQQQLFGRC